MRTPKKDLPTRVDASPDAVARSLPGFGEPGGNIAVDYFKMAKGTDLAPLLQGLTGDMCQAAHWGYLIEGDVVATLSNGETERTTTGDVFYWPGGHSVRADEDTEFVLFSEQVEHDEVFDHILGKLGAPTS